MTRPARTKATRWDLRVAPEKDSLVRRAAATADQSLTDYVTESAVVRAERELADRSQFTLAEDQWDQFVELLDRPPRETPGLERLFSRPSVFSSE